VDVLDTLIDRLSIAVDPAAEQRIHSSLLLGMLYVSPGHPRLLNCVNRVTEMLDEQLDSNSKLDTAMMLLAYCNIASDAERGIVAAERGSALADRSDTTPFSRLWWYLRLGYHLTLDGRYEEAIATLDRAAEIATGHGFQHLSTVESLLFSYRSVAAASQGDLKGTRECCERMILSARSGRPMPRWHAAQGRIYEACASGNERALAELGPPCIELAREAGMIFIEVLAGAHHAIGLAVTGQRAALEQRLAEQRKLIEGTCLAHFEVEAALVEAWDVLRHEDRSRGRELLAAALRLARRIHCRYVNIFRTTRVFTDLLADACEAGIESDHVIETVRRFRVAPPPQATDRWPWPIKVYTLGRFEVVIDGTALQFSGKAPRKPLALLKAIVALGSGGVPAASLIDALWPDEEGDAARKSFDVTVARLRKLLGRNDAVLVSDEAVTLNPKLCWVDAQSFVTLADGAPDSLQPTDSLYRACRLYAGTFLPGDLEAHWTVKRRESLRSRFTRLVEDVGAAAEAQCAWEEAIAWYRRGLEADELAETFHQGLMRCYRALGRNAEGMAAYRRLRQTLSVTLGIAPSEQSQALAKSLKQAGAGEDTDPGASIRPRPAIEKVDFPVNP
jgi:DNA-binding SARP family transcriptional activator